MTWDVADHLESAPPEVVALYERFIDLANDCGPFTYRVTKSAITLKGTRRGFAGARPKTRSLDGYLDLQRIVEDPRVMRSAPYTQRLFVHHFRVERIEQLDDEFAGWLREAYAVGEGAHMER